MEISCASSAIIIAAVDATYRPSSTFVLVGGIFGVASIIFVVLFSILTVLGFFLVILTHFICQLVYLGIHIGNHSFHLKIIASEQCF